MSATGLLQQFHAMLMESQYWSPAALVDYQRTQLSQLLRHARANVPFYATRLDGVFTATGEIDWDRWHEIPIVTREDMHQHREAMLARQLPPGHGATGTIETSGSTGLPIRITTNRLTGIAANANRWRAHGWAGLDWSRTYTARDGDSEAAAWPDGQTLGPWGPPWVPEAAAGRSFRINRNASNAELLEYLGRTGSSYFSTGPKTLHILALLAERMGADLRLDCVMTQGERLTEADKLAIRRGLGARTLETYSSKEAGQIAHPCERQEGLHVHAESVLVEIVDGNGRPVPEGEIGRVIVTPFVSTAQPLIRYEQGDFARFAPACSCGRGLPVLAGIEGRTLAIFTHPDGHNAVGMMRETARAMLNCSFWQFAQIGPCDFEVRYVPKDDSAAPDEAGVVEMFREIFFADARLRLVPVAQIAPTPAGKYIEYVNEWSARRPG